MCFAGTGVLCLNGSLTRRVSSLFITRVSALNSDLQPLHMRGLSAYLTFSTGIESYITFFFLLHLQSHLTVERTKVLALDSDLQSLRIKGQSLQQQLEGALKEGDDWRSRHNAAAHV